MHHSTSNLQLTTNCTSNHGLNLHPTSNQGCSLILHQTYDKTIIQLPKTNNLLLVVPQI